MNPIRNHDPYCLVHGRVSECQRSADWTSKKTEITDIKTDKSDSHSYSSCTTTSQSTVPDQSIDASRNRCPDENTRKPYNRGFSADRRDETSIHKPWSLGFVLLGVLISVTSAGSLVFCGEKHHSLMLLCGVLATSMGIWGLWHDGKYYNFQQTSVYVLLCFTCHMVALVSLGMLCDLLVPRLWLKMVNLPDVTWLGPFLTNSGRIRWGDLDLLCVCLDLGNFILIGGCLLSITAALLVLYKYWRKNGLITGDYKPHSVPVTFNPMVHVYLSHTCLITGLISSAVPVSTPVSRLFSPVWAGYINVMAGVASTFACKKPDSIRAVALVIGFQLVALVSLVLSATLVALGITKECRYLFYVDIDLFVKETNASLTWLVKHSGWHTLYETSLVTDTLAFGSVICTLVSLCGQLIRTASFMLKNSSVNSRQMAATSKRPTS